MAALLFTDVVDSTALVERLGDTAAAALWAEHDEIAHTLLVANRGREIDHSDGFFLLFDAAVDAAHFALDYNAALRKLGISSRVGLHVGGVTLRENPPAAVARGAKPLEVEGLAKPLAARVMSIARGGQMLLTAPAVEALGAGLPGCEIRCHGHYRAKGIGEPLEIHELGFAGTAFMPPADGEKVYRVVRDGGLWRPLREIPHNLFPERDAFIGRSQEIARLAQLLDSGRRLVTLLGVGGTGKTRLARRYARTWLGEWPGGVAFCDLSEARSLEGIQFVVAMALEVPLARGDPGVQLGHAIAARGRCLVILDNFEQVRAHAQATVGAWLDLAPQAFFIVTSRERLRLTGEGVFAVEPLTPLSDAIELFVARAQAQQPEFRLDETNRTDAAEIVRLLDGLPLAVELAAARVRVLSPAQIVQRLRDRFALLTNAGGAVARQATLRAAIDWSWELLQPWEQIALAQCSMFEGGFALDAAEEVIDLAAFSQAPPVVDVVQSLLDKSLLRTWTPDAAARFAIAEPLFGMYLTIHEYAADKLAGAPGGLTDATEVRHGRHYAAHGSQQKLDSLLVEGSASGRRALLHELDNLAAACRRALRRGDPEVAAPAYRAAWEGLVLCGPLALGVTIGESVLAMPGLDPERWLDVALNVADAQMRCGLLTEARGLLEMVRERARAADDIRREGISLNQIAQILREQGALADVRPCAEAALALHRRAGNRMGEAAILQNLGNVLDQLGEPEASRVHHEAALALYRAIGNRLGEAHVRSSLAILDRHQGRLHDSIAQYEAALAILREFGDQRGEAIAVGNLANVYQDLGREDDCRHCLEMSLAMNRRLGSRIVEAYVLANLALAHERLHDFGRAREMLELALSIDHEVGNRIHEGVVLTNLGELEAKQQRHAEARQCFESALARHRETGNRLYVGMTSGALAQTLLATGQPLAALPVLDEGERLLRAIDNPVELGELLAVRGLVCHALGDITGAHEALHLCESIAKSTGAESRVGAQAVALGRLLAIGA